MAEAYATVPSSHTALMNAAEEAIGTAGTYTAAEQAAATMTIPPSSASSSSSAFDNESLVAAVNEWVSDRDSAEAKYGNINDWDVSQVTDMHGLFQDKEEFNDDIGQVRWIFNQFSCGECFR